MIVMPRFRKLYVDVVTDDGTVCIAYVAALEAGWMTIAPAGIEHYGPHGSRDIKRGHASLSLETEPESDATTSIRFDLDDGPCTLEIEPEQRSVLPVTSPPAGLTWRVKHARAGARIRGLGGRHDLIEGTAYADWVELGRLPRSLDLTRLHWGRLHLASGTVIYTWVEHRNGPAWRSATWWPLDGPQEAIDAWSFVCDAGGGACALGLHQGGHARHIELVPERALHLGAAVDAARFPSWTERAVSRLVAGPTAETRWLSRARSPELGDGWAVHESVRFGRAAGEVAA